MRKNDWMKIAVVAAGLCLGALGSYAQEQSSSQQTGDPVADAARKAREEREKKNAQKPKRVFTDEDVKPTRPAAPDKAAPPSGGTATAPTNGTQGTSAAGAQKGEDAAATENPHSEKAWPKRFSEQHQNIAKAEQELD